jgi:Tfp pilus assembly protein PilO
MKNLADIFLNQSYGDMAAFVRTVNARSHILSVVTVHVQGYMNVHDASGNFR